MRLSVIIIFLLSNLTIKAQDSSSYGRVQIIQSSLLNDIIEKRKAFAEKQKTIPGFRVQIFFDSGNNARNKANSVKANFTAKYPNVEAYLSFQQPYFKVRVGDFRTRLEAEKFAKQIESEYNGCFIVKDDIELPKIE